jgi:hypothetical protein
MAQTPKTKETYGTVTVDRLSPEYREGWPKSVNMIMSFEEALKLQLGLQHALLEINKLKRSTVEGRRAAVNLCLHTGSQRITVNPAKVRR